MPLRDVISENLHQGHFSPGGTLEGKYTINFAPEFSLEVPSSIVTGSDNKVYIIKSTGDPLVNPVGDTGGNWLCLEDANFEAPNSPPVINTTTLTNQAPSTSLGSISATDPDGDTIAYSITGGADQALFTVNPTTGAVDFVSPSVAGTYVVEVSATDGTDTAAQNVTVTVAASANSAPVITTTTLITSEFSTTGGTVVATDSDGDTLTYSITGGADQALFTINSSTGEISFINPAPAGNSYVEVTVSDGQGADTKTILVQANATAHSISPTSGTSYNIGQNDTFVFDLYEVDALGHPFSNLSLGEASGHPNEHLLFDITPSSPHDVVVRNSPIAAGAYRIGVYYGIHGTYRTTFVNIIVT